MWTVGSGAGGDGEHAFLILSRRDSSMVLETGQEINELDSSGFCTAGPTVFAGNLGANRFIVQVTADSVRLLQHTELVQELKLDMLDGPVQVSKSYLTQCENPICRLPAWRTPTWPCWRPMASALC